MTAVRHCTMNILHHKDTMLPYCPITSVFRMPLSACTRLACLFVALGCIYAACSPVFAVDATPPEWSKGATPEQILVTADNILNELKYYRGFKSRKVSDPSRSFEAFHRKREDGVIETKTISLKRERGDWVAMYVSKEGKWIQTKDGITGKFEFEDGEDSEKRFAGGIANPYSYSMMPSETMGSNEFLVISRKMSTELFQALYDDMKKGMSPEDMNKILSLGHPLESQIQYENVYYIRKTDGISFGRLIKNYNGAIIDDELFDDVDIHKPISENEIGFNKIKNAPAYKSSSEFKEAVVKETIRNASKKESLGYHRRTDMMIATSLAALTLLGLLYRFFRKLG